MANIVAKKKKIKHFISLESNIQLEERNYLAATFAFPYTFFLFVSSITTQQLNKSHNRSITTPVVQ